MAPPSVHSNTDDKKFETVKVEDAVDVTQDITAIPVYSLPECLQQYSPEQLKQMEKKIVRRVDIRCLPILILLFLLNILDRNAIANARLGGLEADLNMTDSQYQTAIMVLWAGYISMMMYVSHGFCALTSAF